MRVISQVNVNVRLPKKLKSELVRLAKTKKKTISSFIRDLIVRDYLTSSAANLPN